MITKTEVVTPPIPCPDLPPECWETILSTLTDHQHHFEHLSLISHRFLSLTNHLRHTFTITPQSLLSLPKFPLRFPNIKALTLPPSCQNLNPVLIQISKSNLKLTHLNISKQFAFPLMGIRELGKKMIKLKTLCCLKVNCLQDCDLVAIGLGFPGLEEIDLSYSNGGLVTDSGVVDLVSKVVHLRKINLSGNHFISDKSLVALATSCFYLEEVLIFDCDFITEDGIAWFIRNCRNLNYIGANNVGFPSVNRSLIDSFVNARRLSEIHLSDSYISNELLAFIGEAGLTLKKLSLSNSCGFTFEGLFFLLSKNQSVVYLDLEGANFLSDDSIVKLCKYLHSLRYINLNSCSKLTTSGFSTILAECSSLHEIHMEKTNLGVDFCDSEFSPSRQVKHLNLANNNNLSDEPLKKIAISCPNIEILDLSLCVSLTGEGIVDALQNLPKVRHLSVNWIRTIDSFKMELDLPNMEIVQAKGTWLVDDALLELSKRCPRLLHLDLQACSRVTADGVRGVVENCKILREINLKACDIVIDDIIAWMVFARPSLRKIIPSSGFIPNNNKRDFFLRHGCLICDG
ncbi:hypothetical protein ACFE04_031818 [Oxalis oulophora]